jgi:hypothetical protein
MNAPSPERTKPADRTLSLKKPEPPPENDDRLLTREDGRRQPSEGTRHDDA